MVEILIDSFNDTIKIVPLIFIIFILVDLFMKYVNKNNGLFDRVTKYDYLGGSLFGIIPQCGISVAFARLYTSGYITIGMLVAVFISTSDEALIIIGAHPDKLLFMLLVILIKVILAIVSGFFINRIIKEKRNRIKACPVDCDCPRCKKYGNIILDNLVHTLKITIYLLITVFIINFGVDKLGPEKLGAILGKNTFLQPIYASLIGMIPSCASSVLVAEGFIKGSIGFGALIAGLCANTGYGVLIIFKELPFKRALKIVVIVQSISILFGEVIYILWR